MRDKFLSNKAQEERTNLSMQALIDRMNIIEDTIKNKSNNSPVPLPLNMETSSHPNPSAQTDSNTYLNVINNTNTQRNTKAPRFALALHEKKTKFQDFHKRLALRVNLKV